jgi:transposase
MGSRTPPVNAEEWAEIVQLSKRGLPATAISAKTGRHVDTVRRLLRRARAAERIRGSRPRSPGERAAAVARYASGVGTSRVAREFDVSPAAILDWVTAAGIPRRPSPFFPSESARAIEQRRAARG